MYGSYSVQSIDDLAYLIVLGIDEGDSNNLKITFEFTRPIVSGEGAPAETSPSIINSVEASSIDSAINLMNTHLSKEINLSHCKAVVISESLASKGVSKIIYSLINKVQIRPDSHVIVTKCPAKEYVEATQPMFENLISKYYETAPVSSQYTGYTENVTLGEFFNNLNSSTTSPTAMLGSLNVENHPNNTDTSNNSFTSETDSETTAGSTPTESNQLSETMGVAVFDHDVLVGELTAKETLCHLLICNDVDSCNISIPHPDDSAQNIDLYLYNTSNPNIKIEIINGSPFINIKLDLEARILSINPDSKYDNEEKLLEISNSTNQYVEKIITDYLYKTSTRLKTDIDGFGKYALSLFLTEDEFNSYQWLENYKDSTFNVEVDTHVKSSFLLSGTQ